MALEVVGLMEGRGTGYYSTPLAVAKATVSWQKSQSGYFTAAPHMGLTWYSLCFLFHEVFRDGG
jgi:hypothetical protein